MQNLDNVVKFNTSNISKFQDSDETFKDFKDIFEVGHLDYDDKVSVNIGEVVQGVARKVSIDGDIFIITIHKDYTTKNKKRKYVWQVYNPIINDERVFDNWQAMARFFNVSIEHIKTLKVINFYKINKVRA